MVVRGNFDGDFQASSHDLSSAHPAHYSSARAHSRGFLVIDQTLRILQGDWGRIERPMKRPVSD